MTLKKNSKACVENIELLGLFKMHFKGNLNLARVRLFVYL